MGKPANIQNTADRSRSWARSLTWAKPAKYSSDTSKSELPITEPRVADHQHNGTYNTNTSAGHAATKTEHSDSITSSNDTSKPVVFSVPEEASAVRPAAAPPPLDTEAHGEKPTAIDGTQETKEPKPPLTKRAKAGGKRFGRHFKNAIFHSWINVLLVFVPIGIVAKGVGLNAAVVFAMNAVAIVPLAGLLAHATESVAARLGDTLGALLNVSFGNAVELIIL
jgi:Ca2+:H+ antiporter